jgi:hypothetical protein
MNGSPTVVRVVQELTEQFWWFFMWTFRRRTICKRNTLGGTPICKTDPGQAAWGSPREFTVSCKERDMPGIQQTGAQLGVAAGVWLPLQNQRPRIEPIPTLIVPSRRSLTEVLLAQAQAITMASWLQPLPQSPSPTLPLMLLTHLSK